MAKKKTQHPFENTPPAQRKYDNGTLMSTACPPETAEHNIGQKANVKSLKFYDHEMEKVDSKKSKEYPCD